MKKAYIVIIILLVILIVLIGIFSFRRSQLLYLYRTEPLPENDRNDEVVISETEVSEVVEEVDQIREDKIEKKDISFLILGLDTRQDNYSGRSDVVILVDINHDKRSIKLISFMRDLYVEIKDHGQTKLGHAYAYGREKLAKETLENNFGVAVDEYIVLNFEDVVDIVDAMGGVELDVTRAESSQVSGIDTEGTYLLNGTQALQYVRIRNVGNGDFERTGRQRILLEKMMAYGGNLDNESLLYFIGEVYPLIETSFDLDEIYEQLESDGEGDYHVSSMGIPFDNHISEQYIKGIYYLVIEDFELLKNDISEFLNN
ncbi:LCP family protein [Acidaminobacter sp. JC074]|uniref:LCP family protein n=1 Tax=Acidaminobacter sp. JC074 TaxID=2530199 RepID=UPI001F0E4D5B|nr:LCP family protein [Acidaminobacter sp. JC074]